ncbi:MAG: hypothetical protein FJW27_13300 [Acidimicrobiia bacterium]|nr:hypothetical protein [Acidimicrobiia bacterium]
MRTKHRGLDDPTSLGAADQPARISGIQRPEFPEPTRVEDAGLEPVYNRETGALTMLKHDADGNGIVETVSYMQGPRIVRIEIDQDQDGRIDRWEHYGPSQALERVGFSLARDGREDAWSHADASGHVVRVDMDIRRDGRISRTEHFEGGALVRAEQDGDGDGRTDRCETYVADRLTRVSFDTAHTGTPTHTLTYAADGSARVTAAPSSPGSARD